MKLSASVKIQEMGGSVDGLTGVMREQFKQAVAGIAKATQAEWIRLAQVKLKSSRADYINGLRQAESFRAYNRGSIQVYEIQLVGKMPNNFEFGMESFDMKSVRPGWLGGGKAKVSAAGDKYISIPFRHSTNAKSNIFYTGKAAKADLRTKLKETARIYGMNQMSRTATGRVIPGPTRRVPNHASVHPYLRGLTRIQKGTKGTTASGAQRGSASLMTWRTMSENSPAGSWIHPGIQGAKLLPIVQRWADNELNLIVRLIMGGV